MALHLAGDREPGRVQGWEVESSPDHHSWAPGEGEGGKLGMAPQVGTVVETVLKRTPFWKSMLKFQSDELLAKYQCTAHRAEREDALGRRS